MNTETQNKRYLTCFLGTLAGVLLLLAGFNYTIDPYGIYRAWDEGDVFPAANTYARIHKTERIKRIKPEVALFGTSRTDIGMDPDGAFFDGKRVYNAGLPGAPIYEQRRMLEFTHRVHPLETAVLGLDFLSFNAARSGNRHFEERLVSEAATRPVTSFFNTYNTVVSFNTLLVSIKHLRYMDELEKRSYNEANGHKMHKLAEWRAQEFGEWRNFESDRIGRIEDNRLAHLSYAYSDKPGDTTFRHFRAMLDFAHREGIDLYLYFSPIHKSYLDAYKEAGMWDAFEDWKKRITDMARGYGYPLWDFATYNPVTTEPIPPKGDTTTRMRWFWDNDHYKEEAGDIILRKLFDLPGADEHPEFGEKLL